MNIRQLTLNELESQFDNYITDIEYCNHTATKDKLTQLLNFLQYQDISLRIFERIESDYEELKTKLSSLDYLDNSQKHKIIEELHEPYLQGAFSYFTIISKFNEENKLNSHYIDLSFEWYNIGGDYNKYQEHFNNYFLTPFKNLFLWYVRESKVQDDSDFFSYKEQINMFDKLDDILELLKKQGYGQEVIFNEIDDIKKLIKKLNKKNLGEIIKGKFFDLAINGVVNIETAKGIIEILTNMKLNPNLIIQ